MAPRAFLFFSRGGLSQLCFGRKVSPLVFLGGGGGDFQQIQLRTEDRENGDRGAVAL